MKVLFVFCVVFWMFDVVMFVSLGWVIGSNCNSFWVNWFLMLFWVGCIFDWVIFWFYWFWLMGFLFCCYFWFILRCLWCWSWKWCCFWLCCGRCFLFLLLWLVLFVGFLFWFMKVGLWWKRSFFGKYGCWLKRLLFMSVLIWFCNRLRNR